MTSDDGSGRHPFEKTGGDLGSTRGGEPADTGVRRLRGIPASGDDSLAPVIPLFGGAPRTASPQQPARGSARDAVDVREEAEEVPLVGEHVRPRLRAIRDDAPEPADDLPAGPDENEVRERAEAVLLRKLRSRSLSLSEARTVARMVEGADDVIAEDVIERFVDLGYLDDATFAEQLVMSAIEKRGEGRRAVAETLRKRGIPRDIVDAALAELPDDDAERALDFARSKVRGVEGKDHDAALRRLAGQLARRGYPSSVALTAARAALDEVGMGRSRSFSRSSPPWGVRFTPDE